MSEFTIFADYYTLPISDWNNIKNAAHESPYADIFAETFNLWEDSAFTSTYDSTVVFIPRSLISDVEKDFLLNGDLEEDGSFAGGYVLGYVAFTKSNMPIFNAF